MKTPQLTRTHFLKNLFALHLARELSALWFSGTSDHQWKGSLAEGECRWSGDDGAEWIVLWDQSSLLAVASVPECDRTLEEEEWDEDEDPSGESRGLEFLSDPPKEIRKLYKKALSMLDAEFITAGFWAAGEKIIISDSWEEDLDSGMDMFEPFDLALNEFLLSDRGGQALSELLGFDGPLEEVAKLAPRIAEQIFEGRDYSFSAKDLELLTIPVEMEYAGKLQPKEKQIEEFKKIVGDFARALNG